MKKYSFEPINNEGDFMWQLYEEQTEQIIGHFFFEEDCAKMARFMENGGAFDGWTPGFILQDLGIERDINLEFSSVFSDAA